MSKQNADNGQGGDVALGIDSVLQSIAALGEKEIGDAIRKKEAELEVIKAQIGRLRELAKIAKTHTPKKPRQRRAPTLVQPATMFKDKEQDATKAAGEEGEERVSDMTETIEIEA